MFILRNVYSHFCLISSVGIKTSHFKLLVVMLSDCFAVVFLLFLESDGRTGL